MLRKFIEAMQNGGITQDQRSVILDSLTKQRAILAEKPEMTKYEERQLRILNELFNG
jgi:hypothetical protein